MLSPSLLAPLWPSANLRAASLLPIAPADRSPGSQLAGVTFVRSSSAIPNQDDDPLLPANIVPPFNATDDGTLALAWLLAADNALATPGGVAPKFVDLMFSASPGVNRPPSNGSRLIVGGWEFWQANSPMPPTWDAIGGGPILLTENEGLRVPWETLVGNSGTSTGQMPDALAFVPMVPSGRTIAPGRALTFVALAVFT